MRKKLALNTPLDIAVCAFMSFDVIKVEVKIITSHFFRLRSIINTAIKGRSFFDNLVFRFNYFFILLLHMAEKKSKNVIIYYRKWESLN